MTPTTQNNPAAHAALNGGVVLHVRNTTEVRRLRTDHEAEQALAFLKKTLASDVPGDHPSISLLVRRSLKVYRNWVTGLLPSQLDREKEAVREHSLLPRRKKKATKTGAWG